MEFMGFAIILNFLMCAQGYFFGCLSDNPEAAQQINGFTMMIFMLLSGGLGSIDSFPWIL